MKFKDFLIESKFTEGNKVTYDGEVWEVIEVIGKNKIKISSADGKQHIEVFNREVTLHKGR